MSKLPRNPLADTPPAHIAQDPRQTDSVEDLNLPEAPLLSLLEKDMDSMSDEELRAHVQKLRENANNVQTFTANIKKPPTKKPPAKKRAKKKPEYEIPKGKYDNI